MHQQKAIEQTLYYLDVGRKLYPNVDIATPQILFNLKGLTAGKAMGKKKNGFVWDSTIRYNLVLLKENFKDFLKQTVPHEVAHIVVAHAAPGAKPHGKEWKSVMMAFGCKPSRCHSYDTTNARVKTTKRFEYRCGCRTHLFTAHRHSKATKYAERGVFYICKACKSTCMPVSP